MNKKTFALVGMIVSIALVLCGVLAMTGALGGDAGYSSGASYLYDTGYASFGADFYTYVSNNAAEAASATRTVASNQVDIADLLKSFFGIFLMGFGAMGFCGFGIVYAATKEAEADVAPKMESVEENPAEPEPEAEISEV